MRDKKETKLFIYPRGRHYNTTTMRGPNLIHRNDILNGLLAIQATYRIHGADHKDGFEEGFHEGFDTALLAVAQMLGQSETFLTQKAKFDNSSLER